MGSALQMRKQAMKMAAVFRRNVSPGLNYHAGGWKISDRIFYEKHFSNILSPSQVITLFYL